MIATLAEVKILLGISTSTNDSLINANIPLIENFIVDYTNNFRVGEKYITASSVIFTASDKKITGFSNSSFLDTFYVDGSVGNDGVYTVATKTSLYITVSSIYSLVDETVSSEVWLMPLKFPKELKQIVAKMVQYNLLQSKRDESIRAESIDDYSVTFGTIDTGYPANIMSMLNKFKKVSW